MIIAAIKPARSARYYSFTVDVDLAGWRFQPINRISRLRWGTSAFQETHGAAAEVDAGAAGLKLWSGEPTTRLAPTSPDLTMSVT